MEPRGTSPYRERERERERESITLRENQSEKGRGVVSTASPLLPSSPSPRPVTIAGASHLHPRSCRHRFSPLPSHRQAVHRHVGPFPVGAVAGGCLCFRCKHPVGARSPFYSPEVVTGAAAAPLLISCYAG
ncbi:uncharacterized protein [Arachis hypogaea]|uniref:uncharacterized protein n=1 Tax=Arachis hypogaea TaxID=3818 RepID=UPI000DECF489|nr:uncharacterized protein LOC112797460 [Arachis hypogaea]